MTEKSYYWDGLVTGDATLAPYDHDEWSDNLRELFVFDNTKDCVLFGNGKGLVVTNPGGLTIRVGTGAALVDGKVYVTDSTIDFTLNAAPGAGTDYYTVVLRKSWAAQTVRAVLLGPVNGGPRPSATQVDGTTWEVEIASVQHTSAGVITIFDRRRYSSGGTPLLGLSIPGDSKTTPITFSIPDPGGITFRELQLLIYATTSTVASDIAIKLNNDSGANYDYSNVSFSGGATAYEAATGQTQMIIGKVNSSPSKNSSVIARIMFPALPGKIHVHSHGYDDNANKLLMGSGVWLGSAAVSRVDITSPISFAVNGSYLALYGIV